MREDVRPGQRWRDGRDEFEVLRVGPRGAVGRFSDGMVLPLGWAYFDHCERVVDPESGADAPESER